MQSLRRLSALRVILLLIFAVVMYLCFWPVPVEPVAWVPPVDAGYTGPYAANTHLANQTHVSLLAVGTAEEVTGPEDIALDAAGRIYTGTNGGRIVRFAPGENAGDAAKFTVGEPEVWCETGGRPLGLDFDARGNLIVADAARGLLQIDPDAKITVLTNEAGGVPIRYADDLDIAQDGRIYFSDASTKFGAMEFGGVEPSSRLDILEHGGHGRLLVYDPADQSTRVVLDGIDFANGVALAADDSYVLINETGSYRVLRYWLRGPRAVAGQQPEVWLDNLPGFPDNIERDRSANLFWIALVSPRSAALDSMAGSPFLRRLAFRLPAFLQPRPVAYIQIIAVDPDGRVVHNLQDPAGGFHANTSVYATADALYLGSLAETSILIAPRTESLWK